MRRKRINFILCLVSFFLALTSYGYGSNEHTDRGTVVLQNNEGDGRHVTTNGLCHSSDSDSGSLDTSFGIDGIVVHDNAAGGNAGDFGKSIITDANGGILVAGWSRNLYSNYDMVIWKYNSDGTLDTTFGTNGIVVHDSAAGGNGNDMGHSITIDANGRILVSGSSVNDSGNYDMVIWSYNSDGTLDTTFGTNGIVVYDNTAGVNSDDYGYSITTDANNRILVTGTVRNEPTNGDMVIWRYNSDGTPDTSFGTDGIVVHWFNSGRSITTDASGRILVTGDNYNYTDSDMVIWRYNSNGTPDTSFGTDGIVVHNNAAGGNGLDDGRSITTDSSGRILVTGYSDNGTDGDMVIWRYNSDGTLDTTFDTDGIVVHDNAAGGNGLDLGYSITIDASGRILVSGRSDSSAGVFPNEDMVIWRYNSDGTLDTTFDTDGIVVHDSAAGGNGADYGYAITTDANGKILVTGLSWNGSDVDMVIWRYIP